MMIKTVKQIRKNSVLMMSTFLMFSSVHAQPVLFSADQWSKRWGRVMNHQIPNASLSLEGRMHSSINKVSHQGWGRQRNEKRNKRGRTPDYNNGFYKRYENDAVKQRYAVPESYHAYRPYSLGNEPYTRGGYYGNYPLMPSMTYPGSLSGGYPGMGVPAIGFPFSSPSLLAPGLTPGMGYPW